MEPSSDIAVKIVNSYSTSFSKNIKIQDTIAPERLLLAQVSSAPK